MQQLKYTTIHSWATLKSVWHNSTDSFWLQFRKSLMEHGHSFMTSCFVFFSTYQSLLQCQSMQRDQGRDYDYSNITSYEYTFLLGSKLFIFLKNELKNWWFCIIKPVREPRQSVKPWIWWWNGGQFSKHFKSR